MVREITSKEEFDTIISGDKVVFIDFYAEWCGPCRFISPEFEKHEKQYAENKDVEFYKINIDNVQDVAMELGIQSIPTFHAYKNKERIEKIVGANRDALTNLIKTGIGRL